MDWDNNGEQPPEENHNTCRATNLLVHNNNVVTITPVNAINSTSVVVNGGGGGAGNTNDTNMLYVKVMTDEQLETLRKQIAVYSTICEQLVDLHKTLSAHQDLSSGGRLGSLYCDPLMASGSHKITARQRWTPTPVQLQILERIFDQGNGTPSKQKIKEITSQLSQHGQISETNVYNWFQNRRARSKRKQLVAPNNNSNAESEVEIEVDSLNEKKTKPEIEMHHSQQNTLAQRAEDLGFQSPEISSELHFMDVLQNPGDDRLTGKMGIPGSYNLYEEAEDYGMSG